MKDKKNNWTVCGSHNLKCRYCKLENYMYREENERYVPTNWYMCCLCRSVQYYEADELKLF